MEKKTRIFCVRLIVLPMAPLSSAGLSHKPRWLNPQAETAMLVAVLPGLVALATVTWHTDVDARWRND